MDEGRNSEARGVLEKAVALNSADWQSQYELAVLLNQAGETARATDLLQKVLKVNPDYPERANNWPVGYCAGGTLRAPALWRER